MNIKENSNPEGRCRYCGVSIRYEDSFCAVCGRPNSGWKKATQWQCGNCHKRLDENDKYCRICGTKVGEGAYEPYQDLMECIYGPMPVDRKHTCKKCGYEWITCLMLDREKYCPKCGGDAPYEEIPDSKKPGRTFSW